MPKSYTLRKTWRLREGLAQSSASRHHRHVEVHRHAHEIGVCRPHLMWFMCPPHLGRRVGFDKPTMNVRTPLRERRGFSFQGTRMLQEPQQARDRTNSNVACLTVFRFKTQQRKDRRYDTGHTIFGITEANSVDKSRQGKRLGVWYGDGMGSKTDVKLGAVGFPSFT